MIELQIEGLKEIQEYVDGLIAKLQSSSFWTPELGEILEKARRYAVSISPVITGSYAGAHRVVVGDMQAALSIDPSARNLATGMLVTRYAGAVERRHQVYSRTAGHTMRLAVRGAEIIGENVIG